MTMNENLALQLRDNARHELMKIKDVESGVNYLNKVKAIEVWAKAEKKDAELQTIIAEQKIRTQRILGRLIQQGQHDGEIKTQATAKSSSAKELDNYGITKKQSSTYKTIASIPDEIFEKEIEEKKLAVEKSVKELTTAGMLTLAKEVKKEEKKAQKEETINQIINQSDNYIKLKKIQAGWYKLKNQFLYYGSNTDAEFINFLPKAKFAFADPPYNANVDHWDNNFKWELDYLQEKADVVAVTPGGWNAFNFYNETKMNYIWEMFCWISNGMTHGKCGYANVIKTSIFGKIKPKIEQDFWKISIKINETEDTKHRGRKPYEFMHHLIEMFSKEKDIVIDPFAGSGTTLIMCDKLNRVSYNAEINKDYVIDIIKRIGEYDKL